MISERARRVLAYRWGFVDGRTHTLEETGAAQRPAITRERVRAIEARALSDLGFDLTGRDADEIRRALADLLTA